MASGSRYGMLRYGRGRYSATAKVYVTGECNVLVDFRVKKKLVGTCHISVSPEGTPTYIRPQYVGGLTEIGVIPEGFILRLSPISGTVEISVEPIATPYRGPLWPEMVCAGDDWEGLAEPTPVWETQTEPTSPWDNAPAASSAFEDVAPCGTKDWSKVDG